MPALAALSLADEEAAAMSPDRSREAGALSVLLVGDLELAAAARTAFGGARTPPRFSHAADLHSAQDQLWSTGARLHPNLILLDLAVGEAARDLLARLKSDDVRQPIPVLVLFDDSTRALALACYRLHANGCLPRPRDPEALLSLLQDIARYWLGGSVLLAPSAAGGASS